MKRKILIGGLLALGTLISASAFAAVQSNGIIIMNGRELNGIIIMNGPTLGTGEGTTGLRLEGARVSGGRLVR
ncbi:MAG: hypothetical protein JNL21_03310 [Myxococcales bacterium]|nr:hypothetical protein [Myxococcales bacterium]